MNETEKPLTLEEFEKLHPLSERIVEARLDCQERVNKQLYENSGLKEKYEEETGQSTDNGLFNAKEPNLAIMHETPKHVNVVYLKARGFKNTEIAEITNQTVCWIGQILRQPWAQKRLLQIYTEAHKDGIDEMLKDVAPEALQTQIDLMRNEKVPAAVRLAAAEKLADRAIGKPVQEMKINSVSKVTLSTIDEIDAEAKRIDAELARLCAGN